VRLPIGAAIGLVDGVIPAILKVVLPRRKPNFAHIAFWIALGYIAFWTVTTTACEAIFACDWIGGGVLMTLASLPTALFILLSLMTAPLGLLYSFLLIAFYFTPPRGWHQGN